jgi:hypothetical protein
MKLNIVAAVLGGLLVPLAVGLVFPPAGLAVLGLELGAWGLLADDGTTA